MLIRLIAFFACLIFAAVLPSCAADKKGKILVVVSSEHVLGLKDGKTHKTGFFMNELGVPTKTLSDAGYEIVFADPDGNAPVMDPISDSAKFFENDEQKYQSVKKFLDGLTGLKKPHRLKEFDGKGAAQFSGVFIPGGHAPMIELWRDKSLKGILRYCHRANVPTAMICHGPIAMLSSLSDPEGFIHDLERGAARADAAWQYAGYRVTVFSNAEEKPNEPGGKSNMLGGYMKFYPEDALRAAGASVSVQPAGKGHIVSDRELITGQNPSSDNELAAALIRLLEKKK